MCIRDSSSDPRVVAAAHAGLEERGFGMSSVRFICGTQDRHKELEGSLARFFGFEDCVLYGSCYDANGGLFETLLTAEDASISGAHRLEESAVGVVAGAVGDAVLESEEPGE